MSMMDYAVNDYGLLMTRDMLKIVASKYCNDYAEKEYEEDDCYFNDELYEAGIIEYVGEFTGEAVCINDDGTNDWGNSDTYKADMLYYVPVQKANTLFKAAYNNTTDLVNEFRERLGEYLPEDFDYRSKIRHICGTYYG